MTPTPTFIEWLLSGRLSPYVKEHRSVGSAPLSIVHVLNPPGDMSDPPTSDFALALIRSAPTRATCDLGVGRFRCRATPGQHCLSAAHFANTVIADDPQDMLIVAFPDEVCRSYLEPLTDRRIDFAPLHARPFNDPLLTVVMTELWQETERGDDISRLFVDSATSLLAVRLWRLSGGRDPARRKLRGLSPWARRRAIEYLESRLGEPVTLTEVAAIVRLSPSHFCTAFRQSFGVPPHRWLIARRIERARELLATPGRLMSISEVALACGFATPAHFAAAFR